jgi:transcriptional regulator with XRE-family HTH domain
VGAEHVAEDWSELVKRHRARHGLTQMRMAAALGVSQRTVSRWERGEDKPSLDQQRLLRDLAWEPPTALLQSLAASVTHCPAPRALSRTQNLRLQALSRPAIEKRPSVIEWIGRDLAPIACGVLAQMLEDKPLQRAIANREIACILSRGDAL